MGSTFIGITYDTHDAHRVAEFWGAALGREVADGASPEHASLLAADVAVSGPRISFHQVSEGKTVKNRVHLDLLSTEYDQEVQRLLQLGATQVAAQRVDNARWITLADPEGNEFDVIAG
jgi:methionine synthase I (cobalamin-dependent)